jgi:dual specificity MAP kinase phosphatase
MPVLVAPSVHALPISTFAALHLDHILAHPPDHILFPFLHGLEGDNVAQNTFFSGSNVRVPAYRGLIWVVCEDDLVKHERKFARSLRVLRRRGPYTGDLEDPVSECESASDSASSDFEDDDEEDEEHMHVEGVVYPEPKVIPMDIDTDVDAERDGEGAIRFVVEPTMKDERERHMHPVVQRPGPIQIQTINLAHRDADSPGTTTSYAFSVCLLRF